MLCTIPAEVFEMVEQRVFVASFCEEDRELGIFPVQDGRYMARL